MFGSPRQCPRCNGLSFHASRTGWLRRLTVLILLRPFRCDYCHLRLWRFALWAGQGRPLRSGEVMALKQPPAHPPATTARASCQS
jgi:hypothetical protein